MKSGDFSSLAENYAKYRPGYSKIVLKNLSRYMQFDPNKIKVADVGAGTGIWSKMMSDFGYKVTAVEPNNEMRKQGLIYTRGSNIDWLEGTAENTNLKTSSFKWLTMASSFHWADLDKALSEFYRVLAPGGFLSILWNPRDIALSPFHLDIEKIIGEYIPNLRRVSSGSDKHVRNYHHELISTGLFEDVIFVEHCYRIKMSKERYIGAWRSVNDIQVQAGPERFASIISEIENKAKNLDEIEVPYKTRSWTVRRKD